MKQQTNVGQSVADFGTLVKAEAAHDAIADSEAAKNFFKRPRLCDGAIEDCNARVGIVAHEGCNLAADEFRFGGSVGSLEKPQFGAGSPSRFEGLFGVVGFVF